MNKPKTNADKYLKDGVSPKAMWYEFKNWYNNTQCTCAYGEAIEIFMKDMAKPTLTEDEKVILRNIDKDMYTIIGFDVNGLYLRSEGDNSSKEYSFYDMFNGLFPFIYDGEEYKISDLLEE